MLRWWPSPAAVRRGAHQRQPGQKRLKLRRRQQVHAAGRMADEDGVGQRLRRLRDQAGATMLFGHDPEQWQATPRAPAAIA